MVAHLLKPRSFENVLDLKCSLSDVVHPISKEVYGVFEKNGKDVISKLVEVGRFDNWVIKRMNRDRAKTAMISDVAERRMVVRSMIKWTPTKSLHPEGWFQHLSKFQCLVLFGIPR